MYTRVSTKTSTQTSLSFPGFPEFIFIKFLEIFDAPPDMPGIRSKARLFLYRKKDRSSEQSNKNISFLRNYKFRTKYQRLG